MNLTGKKVKIVVSEPWDWSEDLLGTILSDHGGDKLLIKLTKPIKGKKLTSDLIELKPRYEKETFKHLEQNHSLTVGGALVTQDNNDFDYIIIGSVQLTEMKTAKTLSIFFISLITLVFVWFNLPTSILYHSEIRSGNQFLENIKEYKKQTGQLPRENDWETLAKLNPIKPYENFYPEYRITDQDNFYLTFIEGFDPPYLQYDTKTKKWEKK